MILIEKDKKEDIVFFVLCCLFALFMLFKIRFGLHYDEGYLVDLGKLKIDRIHSITQCWDVLQMSGWIVYPLLLLYRTVTGGYEGSILFIRVIYILIHLFIAIYVYTTVRLFWTKKQARVASLLSFLFFFHWYTICYKSVLYWGVMLTILFLLRYTYFKKRRYIVVGSIIFSVAVLAYPSLVLLTVPISSYFIGTKEIPNKDLIVFWGVCMFCAIVFLIGIAAESSLETLLQTYQYTISYESSNSSHKLITLIELSVIYVIVNMCLRFYFKNRWINKKIRNVYVFIAIIVTISLAFAILMRYKTASASRFWYVWYMFFCMMIPQIGKTVKVDKQELIKKLFVNISVCLVLTIALSSANGWAVASYGSIFGIIGVMIALYEGEMIKDFGVKILSSIIILMFVFAAVFFVPDNELGASNILQSRTQLESGPGKGIYVTEKTKEKYQRIENVVHESVLSSDNLMILSDGFRCYGFMMTDAKQVTHWPYIVYPDSERAVKYYEMFPELKPTVILIEESFIDTYFCNYEEWIENSALGKYIFENYVVEKAIDTSGWKVAR